MSGLYVVLKLVICIVICESAGLIGALFTTQAIPIWYEGLHQPSFRPPNWVFGPVWTLLYALMAVAAWRVWLAAPGPARNWGLALFAVQLALNLAWSWLFFHRHAIGGAFAEVLTLWVAIGATTIVFAMSTPVAAWLMAPYWAWVSFASILNGAIWRLN